MTRSSIARISEQELAEIKARTRLAEIIASRVALKREGSEWKGLCPFHDEDTPSFTVNEIKGFYHCFGCGAHGDGIAFLRKLHGWSFVEAIDYLGTLCGILPDRQGHKKALRPIVPRPSAAKQRETEEKLIASARRIWAEAGPISGTLVQRYLESRGIRGLLPASLRYNPVMLHRESGQYCPVMVAAVQNKSGRIVGVHRTFLKPDGSGKAEVSPAKKMIGQCWGGAVRFAKPASRLAIAEGIETALSVMHAMNGLPVWAALSLGNMAALELPEWVKEVILCGDADNKNPALSSKLLNKAVEYHRQSGRTVRVVLPPPGMDFNDLLQKGAA